MKKSGITGVTYDATHKVWRVVIHMDGRSNHLGQFKDLDEAIALRETYNPICPAKYYTTTRRIT